MCFVISTLQTPKHKALPYQRKIIQKLNTFIKNTSQKTCLVNSPTGSGKTFTLSMFMEENKTDNLFIWLSNRPNLIEQVKKVFSNQTTLDIIGNNEIQKYSSLAANMVYCTNIESIRRKENKLRQENLYVNSLDTIFENTRLEEKNIHPIVIIDESHYGIETELVEDLMSTLFQPKKIIYVSATPTAKKYDTEIVIPLEEVKQEEIIKKGILVNPTISSKEYENMVKDYSITTFSDYILYKAISHHNILVNLHEKIYNNDNEGYVVKDKILPITLIQIPNEIANDNYLSNLVSFLGTYGISTEKGNLAIYLSELKTATISELTTNSNISFIIFKQSLAMGWDNPRCHNLVMLRTPNTYSFTLQTIGRILRNPYNTYFQGEYEELNYGYIFMDNDNLAILQNHTDKLVQLGLGIEEKKPITTELDLLSKITHTVTTDFSVENMLLTKLENYIPSYIEKITLVLDNDKVSQKIELSQGKIMNNNFTYVNNKIHIEHLSMQDKISRIKEDISRKVFAAHENRIIQSILVALTNYVTANNRIGEYSTQEELNQYVLTLYLDNCAIIHRGLELYYNKIAYNTENYYTETIENYKIPSFISLKKDIPMVNYDKYMFEKDNEITNLLEKRYAEYLETNSKVIMWFKNRDNGKENFSIPYYIYYKKHNYFPDFLIETTENIYIVETKGIVDRKSVDTKANAIVNSLNIIGEHCTKPLHYVLVYEESNELLQRNYAKTTEGKITYTISSINVGEKEKIG